MSVRVLQPGLFTTVQDTGRWGYQKEGVVVGGAMDLPALQLANLLVGNLKGSAALEMTLLGPELLFEQDQLIALTGAPCSASIEGESILVNRPLWVAAGSRLKIGPAKRGCRSYLAIAGGLDVPQVLGSRSTYVRAGWGGYRGRALQQNDLLSCSTPGALAQSFMNHLNERAQGLPFAPAPWSVHPSHFCLAPTADRISLRAMPGPEWSLFSPRSQQSIWNEPYVLTPQSDRMGGRLEGSSLSLKHPVELLSSAVTYGTIQVPAGGQPIALGADRQTTGGYPRIAQVIQADLPILAQARPGIAVYFQEVGLLEAQQLYLQQQVEMEQLALAIALQLKHLR